MIVHFEDLRSKSIDSSIVAYSNAVDQFPFFMHYHPEYELAYITKGHGQRLIGNHSEYFTAGDLVLVEPSLAHTWHSSEVEGEAIVIQFSEEFIQPFYRLKEFAGIKQMLTELKGAFVFEDSLVKELLLQVSRAEGLERITCFLHILNILSVQNYRVISTPHRHFSKQTEKRINQVCRYIQDNYCKDIQLSEVASLIYLSDSAFCKFFRKTTGKTFTDYLNMIRIDAICNELLHTDKPINQIVYRYGYQNQTYFNRIFKKKIGVSPNEYRKNFYK